MNAKNITSALAIAAAAGSAYFMARAGSRQRKDYRFQDKVVLITGGSRGLGLELARQFASHGAHLVLCARDAAELDTARMELEATGAKVLALPCDVADRAQVSGMVEVVLGHFGRIDVLVNNAGTMVVSPIEHVTMEDYHDAMNTNFWGAVNVAYEVVPHMQERRSGRLVNISSIGGKIGVPHMTAYSASKFALSGWSRALRGELAKDNVWVTTIYPGLMRTGSPRHASFKGQYQAEYAWFKVADSLPGISVSSEHAAISIVEAVARGENEAVIGMPAKAAILFDSLVPEISGDVLAVAGRMLPAPGGIGTGMRAGADSETPVTRSVLTTLTQDAERANNELRDERFA